MKKKLIFCFILFTIFISFTCHKPRDGRYTFVVSYETHDESYPIKLVNSGSDIKIKEKSRTPITSLVKAPECTGSLSKSGNSITGNIYIKHYSLGASPWTNTYRVEGVCTKLNFNSYFIKGTGVNPTYTKDSIHFRINPKYDFFK